MIDTFPCSGCGACCQNVDKITANLKYLFPYKWDETGRCEKLNDDNTCSVYDDRPLICNVEKMAEFVDIPKEKFFKLNIDQCNFIMDKKGIDLKFRIKIEKDE